MFGFEGLSKIIECFGFIILFEDGSFNCVVFWEKVFVYSEEKNWLNGLFYFFICMCM